jgi:hypothetical protein
MLSAGEKIRSKTQQTQRRAARENRALDRMPCLGDDPALSLSHQHYLVVHLSYKLGYCWLSVPHMASELRISERMVQYNNDELKALDLLDIEPRAARKGVNKLWPLPKGGSHDQAARQARIDRALACRVLALPFRVLWMIDDATRGSGEWVAIRLRQFGERLAVPHRQTVGNAIELNYQRGLLGWRKGGHGNPGHYRVLNVRQAEPSAAEGIIIEPDGSVFEPAEAAEEGLSDLDYYRQLREGKWR